MSAPKDSIMKQEREAVARAYEQGCIDTHKAIQDDPSLALMPVEHAEFGEAASDYAHSVALRLGGEGWRLVPVELTEAMMASVRGGGLDLVARCYWTAMLAAAPPPPSTQGEG